MILKDVVYAEAKKDEQFCRVYFCDGTADIVPYGIGELFGHLQKSSEGRHYHMIGRSALVCEENIVMLAPTKKITDEEKQETKKGVLVIASDELEIKHKVFHFSEELLRDLRGKISKRH